MLKAKEMAKQMKTMTQSSQEQKEIVLMEELVEVRLDFLFIKIIFAEMLKLVVFQTK